MDGSLIPNPSYHLLTLVLEPSSETRHLFESIRNSTQPNLSKNILTEHFSSYTINVSPDLQLDIRHDDDSQMNVAFRRRLLDTAKAHFAWEIQEYGEIAPLDRTFVYSWPLLPGAVHWIIIGDPQFYMTVGVIFDALHGIELFDHAYPNRRGELIALIKIPHLVPSDPEGLGKYVGWIHLVKHNYSPLG